MTKNILGRSKNSGDGLSEIINDDLDIDKNFYLITDNSKLIFEKYRKKLENIIKSKENITKKRLFKKILLIVASQKVGKQYYLNIKENEKRQKALEQINEYELSRILMELSTKGNVYEDNLIKNILLMICEIFLEFLKYKENLEIQNIYNQINKFSADRPKIADNQTEDEYYDLLINSIIKFKSEDMQEPFNYLEELKSKYLNYKKKDVYQFDEKNSFTFFKYLKLLDNDEFKNKILEILYRQNSQKKIFYENITNIVLFETQLQFNKFIDLKNIFIDLFNTVQNLNLIKRLDSNSFDLLRELEEDFDVLINKLIDEKKWRKENNIFNVYGSSIYNNEENIKAQKDKLDFKRKKTVFNDIIPENNNNNISNKYFVTEFTKENIFNCQQTLYNLGFIDLANQIFEYISWVITIKNELKNELVSLEKILISLYKLLVIFIFDNQKHQFIIREKLYIYICPFKLNIKSQDILLFIGYFLLNIVYFFESYEDFNQIQCLDEVISSINILKNIDWGKNKRIIPFYVQTLKIIISLCSNEYFNSLYQVLEIIDETLVNEILNNNDTKDDILSVIKILELITNEQNKKSNEITTTPILPLYEIVNSFLDMIKLINQNNLKKYLKLFKIFVIVTNLFYNHFSLYKNEFIINKIYRRNLTKILTQFCNSFNLTDEMIYSTKNKTNINIRNLNEFIGISLPKLYIILSSFGTSNSNSEDSLSCLINLSNKLYEKILFMHEKNKKEIIFLTKNMEKELDDILNKIGFELIYLSIIRKTIVARLRLSMPKLIRSLINRKNLVNKLIIKDDLRKETFGYMWNKIRMKINKNEGLNNFQNFVKYEINKERMDYIKFMMDFFDDLLLNDSLKESIEDKYAKEKVNETILSYFDTYIDSIKESYSKNFINYKNEIFFFYWTNIHLMRYNRDKLKFIDDNNIYDFNKINYGINPPNIQEMQENNTNERKIKVNYFDYSKSPYNKVYFNNLNFIEMTIRQFSSININSINYMNLLYIKFLSGYLDELVPEEQSNFFRFFIKQKENENIFSFMKMILDSLDKDINKTISGDDNIKVKEGEKEENKYYSNLLENDINKYELIIQFITKLTADNSEMGNTMKNYLRFQFNNSKSFNFIIILSNILTNFTKDSSNRIYITKYFSIIIQIIDCLAKCCNGSILENQNCIVNDTSLLDFIRNIIKTITYRQKKINDDGLGLTPCYDRNYVEEISENIDDKSENLYKNKFDNEYLVDECSSVGLDRQKLAFLKYKLLYFLSMLTIGRTKGDNIFELIHNVIDFDVLACVLIETYKEILIEKESQDHYENLIFGEDMLQRMDKKIDVNNDINENFIIFEIGTYTFILINIYLENLRWIIDFQILNKISLINKELKEKKYQVTKRSIFDPVTAFGRSIYHCFKLLCIKCGNCSKEIKHEDFFLKNSFYCAYSFYYDYTPNIEIILGDQITKYYVKLSPICKCMTEEMKEDFQEKVDRSSTKAKIEYLFSKVDYYHYILFHAKKRLDLFRTSPFLDLAFNHYKFYRDIYMIIGFLQNVLIFCSLHRTNDEYMTVTEFSPDLNFDYGFLYKNSNIRITRNIFLATTIIQCILSFIILLTYCFNNFPRLLFFEISEKEQKKYYQNSHIKEGYNENNENLDSDDFCLLDYEKKRKNVKLYQKVISFIWNLIQDGMLFYHILMLIICLVAAITQNYKYLAVFIAEIILHSRALKNIVLSFWLPRKPFLLTLILFYLIAYYFIIFVYLFLPHQLPTKDCFSFSDCFFTLCDQAIKNSNGIINYLLEEGLYITHTLYSNPRFWIDNWFAIIDIMLVLQMACSIIINSHNTLREQQRELEKDQNNICFICGLEKMYLNRLYLHDDGFYEHIKLDHYLWNYIFIIFSITKKAPKNLLSADKNIIDNYKKGMYSSWVPYKNCLKKKEYKSTDIYKQLHKEDSEEEEEEEEYD